MARLRRGFSNGRAGGCKPVTAFGALLVQRQITSEALAEAMGYSCSAVRAWRDGRVLPSKGARSMLLRHLPDLDDAKLLALLTSPAVPHQYLQPSPTKEKR